MRLNIAKKSTGREIVAAFLRAARYQESDDVRWEAMDFEDGEGGKGVIAYPCRPKKRFWFFNSDSWVRDFSAEIYLHPLTLDERHDEIQVKVRLATFNPSQRTVVSMADYKKWRKRRLYLYRQLEMILRNAFLIE